MKIILRVPDSRICELWLETETNAQFLASQDRRSYDYMYVYNYISVLSVKKQEKS